VIATNFCLCLLSLWCVCICRLWYFCLYAYVIIVSCHAFVMIVMYIIIIIIIIQRWQVFLGDLSGSTSRLITYPRMYVLACHSANECLQFWLSSFSANVNSSSRSLYAVVRPSVTFVHPTQVIEIFGNVSTPCITLAIHDLYIKILTRSSQGNPSVGELNTRGVAKYSDFWPIERYISETVQDRS